MINIAKSTIPTLSGIFGARSGMQISQSLLQKKDVSQEEKELFSDQKRWGISTALGLVSTVAVALSPISLLSLAGIGAAFTGGAALGAMSEAAMNFIALKKNKKEEHLQKDEEQTQPFPPIDTQKSSTSNQNTPDNTHLKSEKNTTSPSSTSEPSHFVPTTSETPPKDETHQNALMQAATSGIPTFPFLSLDGYSFDFIKAIKSRQKKGVEGAVYNGHIKRYDEKTKIIITEDVVIKVPHDIYENGNDDEFKGAKILKEAGLSKHNNIAHIYGQAYLFLDNKSEQGTVIKKYKAIQHIPCTAPMGPQTEDRTIDQYHRKFYMALIKGIATATNDMLEKGVRHNDLHLSNVMYDTTDDDGFIAKIIDFGMVTQRSKEESALFGLVDYDKKYGFSKAEAQKLSEDKNNEKIDNDLYTKHIDDGGMQNPDLDNNPINIIQKILFKFTYKSESKEKLFENQESLMEHCRNILDKEKELYKLHATLRYLKSDETREITDEHCQRLPDALHQFAKDKNIEGLKQCAKEIAGKIRAEAKKLFKEIAEAPDTLTAA